jgi:hypothetical protein
VRRGCRGRSQNSGIGIPQTQAIDVPATAGGRHACTAARTRHTPSADRLRPGVSRLGPVQEAGAAHNQRVIAYPQPATDAVTEVVAPRQLTGNARLVETTTSRMRASMWVPVMDFSPVGYLGRLRKARHSTAVDSGDR